MNGREMRQFLVGRTANMAALMPAKLDSIERLKSDAEVYAETNHCFIKGFGWFIPEHIPQDQIAVVILKRSTNEIVNSYARILCTPLTDYGRRWLITPDVKHPEISLPHGLISERLKYNVLYLLRKTLFRGKIVKIFTLGRTSYPKFIDTYERQLLDWYVRETHARGERYRQTFKQIKFIECAVDDLNNLDGVERLFKTLELSYSRDTIARHINVRTNLKR